MKEKKAIVLKNKCFGCNACNGSCRYGALTVDRKASIDYEKCIGCGDCVKYCSVMAIKIIDISMKGIEKILEKHTNIIHKLDACVEFIEEESIKLFIASEFRDNMDHWLKMHDFRSKALKFLETINY